MKAYYVLITKERRCMRAAGHEDCGIPLCVLHKEKYETSMRSDERMRFLPDDERKRANEECVRCEEGWKP